MRTSTVTLVVPPTRWKVWSTSTRRILFCVSRGMSAISSMNSVPPCASSSAPTLRACEPFAASTPNSSDFHPLGRDRGGVDHHERPARRAPTCCGCVRAASSLPAPEGPTIRMRLLVGATFSIVWRSWFIAGDWPTSARRLRRELLELLDLALEPRGLERAVRDQHQPVGLERLLDEVVGAALDRRRPRSRCCRGRRSSRPAGRDAPP